MKTSIIILTHNQLDYTKQCIESIAKYTKEGSYEIIIVDNHSTDGTVEWLKQQNNIKVIFNNENLGFPKGCNQGIEIATGENILLLNNDTIVTENWLDNLLACLYSSDDIGAVGPVTNSAAYYSTIPVNYTSIDEMHQFAANYNVSNPDKWEERLKLIGFCMLIKREAVDKVGLLDERFTPGNFEDDDYSVRLRKAGYRLMLCKDTFIHHYGSVSWKKDVNAYSKVLTENEKKFKKKWGTDSNSYRIDYEMIGLITASKEKAIQVLHIGCGSGGTLLKVKYEYPLAQLYGIENNPFSIEEASRFAKVTSSFEDEEIRERKFDVILFSDNDVKLDESLLKFVKEHLKKNGIFIAKVPNIGHYLVIQDLLNGHNPFVKRNMYSFSQIENLLKDAGFKISISGLKPFINDDQQQFINQLISVRGDAIRPMLESSYFLVSGQLENGQLLSLLNKLASEQSNNQKVLEELNHYPTEHIITTVKENYHSSVTMFNQIAIENFAAGYHEHVLPYLQAAFEEEPDHTDTLYNLAFVLNAYGEKELANRYLSLIKNPDDEVQKLFEEINERPLKKIQELKFLLRRLEFDKDLEETKQMIVHKLAQNEIEEQLIKEVINASIIDKIKALQSLAIICFEQGLHEQVLPYLQAAYELDKTDEDTLYNLGYVLLYYGENELAERFLQQIQQPDEEVLDLLKVARGESL
ncbi:glycosyltransferase [Saccharococcus thermophilus]|uniref:GT2 family glycosyltransferase/tetratricopeptide (TPR) repeat protein n=1 Tax=Saccharococcus thermophilus TaxID=29396 RepID=A0A846MHI9_9BACL|nr:glycosyltransferase [Saccharococcus thermophilus]NIK13944.1 GT2 family glycosyltransferase/tetratricopeptide (TPR) repeat protein [Saccharococcus thermophilus]